MIPNDCLIVKPKEGVAPFTHLTWNSNGCPKTIPLDIYKLNEYRLVIVEDPNYLLSPNPEAVPTPPPKEKEPDKEKEAEDKEPETDNKLEEKTEKPDFIKEAKDVTDAMLEGDLTKANKEAKDLMDKVKTSGKGKNKKR